MGLDMHLQKVKKIENITLKQLINADNYYSYLERPEEYKEYTIKDWCGTDINEIDMLVVEKYKNDYIHRYDPWDKNKELGFKTIFETIASWTKAYYIHEWFINNIQNGINGYGPYEVTEEQLKELLNVCKNIVNKTNIEKYDEWYIKNTEYTIEIIEKVLNTTDFKHEFIIYSSSS